MGCITFNIGKRSNQLWTSRAFEPKDFQAKVQTVAIYVAILALSMDVSIEMSMPYLAKKESNQNKVQQLGVRILTLTVCLSRPHFVQKLESLAIIIYIGKSQKFPISLRKLISSIVISIIITENMVSFCTLFSTTTAL